MSLVTNAVSSSMAAAAVLTTFLLFAPEAGSVAPPVATRPAAEESVRSRKPPKLTVASADATCAKVRRKFWVEGEGWIVRRVASC